ncbi:hypothetical protein AK88_03629 [Plasmodium fragile]|uniref:EMP3/KAHRP N-terminal domain-containing protein n=1 Tax=Plasmodium fragile TaxID=5857 RepID=A0A0D9QIV0_PLAFR|nr:uncharacterized protein AK88_03629 [Plasmodium fragile]KJP86717.1 hypothetical protein AK88_03629 [Plasmodium fragile]
MNCHKGAKENTVHLHVKILVICLLVWTWISCNLTRYREHYDMPHNFGKSVASRYDRSLAENIGNTQLGNNKLKTQNGSPTTAGKNLKGTRHTELQVNKKSDVTRDKSRDANTPDDLNIKKRTKRPKDHSLQNAKKPSVEQKKTIKNGLSQCTLKGDNMRGPGINKKPTRSTVKSAKGSAPSGLKVNNKQDSSVDGPAEGPSPRKLNDNKMGNKMSNSMKNGAPSKSTVKSVKGSAPSGLKVNNKQDSSVDGPAEGPSPRKLNDNKMGKKMSNSMKNGASSSSEVSKKGGKITSSPKDSPTKALKANNKEKPEKHPSGKVNTSELKDNTKNDHVPGPKPSELLSKRKDSKAPENTSVQVSQKKLKQKPKTYKSKYYPLKNVPPSGVVGSKRMKESGDIKLKNKSPTGLVGQQKDTKSPNYPLKNIPKSDLTQEQKGLKSNMLKCTPSDVQEWKEQNLKITPIIFPDEKGEYDVNIRSGEEENKRFITKVYNLKRKKRPNNNNYEYMHGVNDPLTLELQEFEQYDKPLYPFKEKLPDLKEYKESSISSDYGLRNKPPELKKHPEGNISKEQLQNKSHNLEAYKESHLAQENGLTNNAPAGLKEYETPDETRDYGLKGYADSQSKVSELKKPNIEEPKIDDQSSSHATEQKVNDPSEQTLTTVANGNNSNAQVINCGISRKIPTDVDQIERTVETVVCALKENDKGNIDEYIETHTTRRYKLKADVIDGVKQYDEKFEKAAYGFREKLPVTEVQEYDVVERIFKKPVKVKEDEIKPIERYTYILNGKKPRPPRKNYGLLDLCSFTFHVIFDRNVYLVNKEHLSLFNMGKKAIQGQLTQELMNEYIVNCVKQKTDGKESEKKE